MAYNTAEGRAEYTATSAQTDFPFSFKIFDTSNVVVFLTPYGSTPNDTDDILTEITDYTVTISGDNGGLIELVTPASTGDSITAVRSLPTTRETDYQNNGDLYAEALDEDQNYQTYLIADAELNQSDRNLTIPVSTQGFDTVLPSPIADGYIRFAPDGKSIVNDDTVPTNVTLAVDSATAAALSETNAAASEEAAALSETNAAISEENAAASAAGVNLPPIAGGDALKHLRANIGETGFELVEAYTKAEIDSKRVLTTPTVQAEGQNWAGVVHTDLDAVGANPSSLLYPDGSIVTSTDNGEYTKYPNGDVFGRVTDISGYSSGVPIAKTMPIVLINNAICSHVINPNSLVDYNTMVKGTTSAVTFYSSSTAASNIVSISFTGRWK